MAPLSTAAKRIKARSTNKGKVVVTTKTQYGNSRIISGTTTTSTGSGSNRVWSTQGRGGTLSSGGGHSFAGITNTPSLRLPEVPQPTGYTYDIDPRENLREWDDRDAPVITGENNEGIVITPPTPQGKGWGTLALIGAAALILMR